MQKKIQNYSMTIDENENEDSLEIGRLNYEPKKRNEPKGKNMFSQQSHNLTTFNFEEDDENPFSSKKLEKKSSKSKNFSMRDFP